MTLMINIKYTIQSIVCEASCHHVISPIFSTLRWTNKQTNNIRTYRSALLTISMLAFKYRNFVYNIVLVDS